MQINDLVNILKENYRLEKSMIDYTIDVISESGIKDFKNLLHSISKSKKFYYISKLTEAIDKNKIKVELNEIEYTRAITYADKLFSKTTSVFDEVDYQVSIGQDINSTQMTNFIHINLNEKDRQVLKLIGDRNRLLFMIRGMREALREQIKQKVEDLSIQKKKEVMGLSMTQKNDNENKMIKLLKGN